MNITKKKEALRSLIRQDPFGDSLAIKVVLERKGYVVEKPYFHFSLAKLPEASFVIRKNGKEIGDITITNHAHWKHSSLIDSAISNCKIKGWYNTVFNDGVLVTSEDSNIIQLVESNATYILSDSELAEDIKPIWDCFFDDAELTRCAKSAGGNTGCYIATCVYGSYDCPEVWVLRRYRDNTLSNSWFGRKFIRLYYTVSPKIVSLFGNRKWFNRLFKSIINKIVIKLRKNGVADKPYTD